MDETKEKNKQDNTIMSNDLIESNLGQLVNTVNTSNINLSDIENQNGRNINEAQESARTQYELTQFRITTGMLLVIMIIMYTSFIVCDIYFALNDDSCVTQDVSRLSFNLKTFLFVRGFILLGLITNIILTLSTVTHSIIKFCTYVQISIIMLISIFLLVWNIIGAVLFWGYMDTSKCTNPVYNYTFVSLVIAFVSAIINLITKNSKDGK